MLKNTQLIIFYLLIFHLFAGLDRKLLIYDIWYFLRDGSEISTLKEENNIDIDFKNKLDTKIFN